MRLSPQLTPFLEPGGRFLALSTPSSYPHDPSLPSNLSKAPSGGTAQLQAGGVSSRAAEPQRIPGGIGLRLPAPIRLAGGELTGELLG